MQKLNLHFSLLILIFILLTIGCSQVDDKTDKNLTLNDVTTALKQEELYLSQPTKEHALRPLSPFYELNGVQANHLIIDSTPIKTDEHSRHTILIYVFDSTSSPAKAVEELERKNQLSLLVPHKPYTSKNILIYYMNTPYENIEQKIQKAMIELANN